MLSGTSLSIQTVALPRLDLEALRASLADPGVACVFARHPARLLSHLGPAAMPELAAPFSWSERVDLAEIYGRAGAALGRMGLCSSRAREILVAEMTHLARALGSLTGDLAPWIHLDLAEAGDEL